MSMVHSSSVVNVLNIMKRMGCVCVCVCFKESGSCSNTVGLVKKTTASLLR